MNREMARHETSQLQGETRVRPELDPSQFDDMKFTTRFLGRSVMELFVNQRDECARAFLGAYFWDFHL